MTDNRIERFSFGNLGAEELCSIVDPSDEINICIKQSNIRIAIFKNSLYNKFV